MFVKYISIPRWITPLIYLVQLSVFTVVKQLHKEGHQSPSKWPSKVVTLPSRLIATDLRGSHQVVQSFFEDSASSPFSH